MVETRLEYEVRSVYENASSRAGVLHTSIGSFELPATAPGVRTSLDIQALDRNLRNGMKLRVLAPLATHRASLTPTISQMFFPQHSMFNVTYDRPLIIADPESEALSFNCIAREQYQSLNASSRVVKAGNAVNLLLNTSLSGSGGTQETHAAWSKMEQEYGFAPLISWIAHNLNAAKSDILSIPTPLIRAEARTAERALEIGKKMLPVARSSPNFMMFGLHFLLHVELFHPNTEAEDTRQSFLKDIRKWSANSGTQGLFVSMKIFDDSNSISDQGIGNVIRRNVSEFMVDAQASVASAGGVLVVHNVGNRALGFIDSGADIVSVRVTGKPGIDRQRHGKKGERGHRPVPPLTLPRSMVEEDPNKVRAIYISTGAFPVPNALSPQPYWSYQWTEQQIYVARARCGVFVDVAEEYRAAALDDTKPLSESVTSRVRDAGNSQELADLCPSIQPQ